MVLKKGTGRVWRSSVQIAVFCHPSLRQWFCGGKYNLGNLVFLVLCLLLRHKPVSPPLLVLLLHSQLLSYQLGLEAHTQFPKRGNKAFTNTISLLVQREISFTVQHHCNTPPTPTGLTNNSTSEKLGMLAEVSLCSTLHTRYQCRSLLKTTSEKLLKDYRYRNTSSACSGSDK